MTKLEEKIEKGKISAAYSDEQILTFRHAHAKLNELRSALTAEPQEDPKAFFETVKTKFGEETKLLKKKADQTGKKLSNAFKFCEEIFPDSQEILIFVTEITINFYSAHFVSRYGCKEYFKHNKELLFFERQREIIMNMEKLDLD